MGTLEQDLSESEGDWPIGGTLQMGFPWFVNRPERMNQRKISYAECLFVSLRKLY